MSLARTLALLLVLVLVGACGGVAPPVRDQFHRLTLETPEDEPPPALDAPLIVVAPFTASGLHGQRALVHATADETTLQQYGYHFWIDSPRQLLQEALAAHLRGSTGARVLTSSGTHEGLMVRGQVYRFERVDPAGVADQAVVSLGFEVFSAAAKVPALARRYERRVRLQGPQIADYLAATSAATRDIFAEFARELGPLFEH